MPHWLSEDFIRRHALPVSLASAIIIPLALVVLVFSHHHIQQGLWIAFCLGGFPIGRLTPEEKIDHRGTNGSFVMILGWLSAILLSRHVIGTHLFVSDWVWALLTFNVICGFSLVMGILAGSYFRQHPHWKQSLAKRFLPQATEKQSPKTIAASYWAASQTPSSGTVFGDLNQTKDSSSPEN